MKKLLARALAVALIASLTIAPSAWAATAATAKDAKASANETVAKDTTDPEKKIEKKVVVIDAGHGAYNRGTEPLGPGSKKRKAKDSGGTQGCVTKVSERTLNLKLAKQLKTELEKRGYKVVMTRTSNKQRISNVQRAKIANKNKADAYIRIHANSSSSSSAKGALSIAPTSKNKYMSKKLRSQSYNLSKQVLKHLCKTTKAKNRGVWRTDTMTGINWCKVPVTIVEVGFMSNPSEDRKMQKPSYQKKIVKGIANGVDAFLKKR